MLDLRVKEKRNNKKIITALLPDFMTTDIKFIALFLGNRFQSVICADDHGDYIF